MSDSNPTFSIQRKYVLGLGRWLQTLSLYGRESRERTKFVELLSEEVKEHEAMRLDILKKYADLDPVTKEPIVITSEDKSEHFQIPDEKLKEFSDEMVEYLEEDFTVSGDGNKQRLKTLKTVVLDTPEKIDPQVAGEYDKWCEAFEKVEV